MHTATGAASAPDVQATSPAQAPAPVTVQGTQGAPATLAGPTDLIQLKELRARRSEISSQIGNVTSRRDDIASQLRNAAPGADRAGLESRLATLDARIVELENELNVTGRQLANARGVAATVQDPPSPPESTTLNSDQTTGIIVVFTLAVLMPLSIAWARAIFRRAKHATEQPSRELTARLDRMEEGIEAIAIEVERISEGQRFVTKVIGAGAAEPVAVARGESVKLDRGA